MHPLFVVSGGVGWRRRTKGSALELPASGRLSEQDPLVLGLFWPLVKRFIFVSFERGRPFGVGVAVFRAWGCKWYWSFKHAHAVCVVCKAATVQCAIPGNMRFQNWQKLGDTKFVR